MMSGERTCGRQVLQQWTPTCGLKYPRNPIAANRDRQLGVERRLISATRTLRENTNNVVVRKCLRQLLPLE